jgi:hypothetical protein
MTKITIDLPPLLYEALSNDARALRILTVEDCAISMIENGYRWFPSRLIKEVIGGLIDGEVARINQEMGFWPEGASARQKLEREKYEMEVLTSWLKGEEL